MVMLSLSCGASGCALWHHIALQDGIHSAKCACCVQNQGSVKLCVRSNAASEFGFNFFVICLFRNFRLFPIFFYNLHVSYATECLWKSEDISGDWILVCTLLGGHFLSASVLCASGQHTSFLWWFQGSNLGYQSCVASAFMHRATSLEHHNPG